MIRVRGGGGRLAGQTALWVILIGGATLLALLGVGGLRAQPGPRLPDLQTLPPHQLQFQVVAFEDGQLHKALLLSNTVGNYGAGQLELAGLYDAGLGQTRVTQRIFNGDGSFTERHAGNFIFHPAHNHWHLEDFAYYQLHTASNLTLGAAVPNKFGAKTTFCIGDVDHVAPGLPGSPATPGYTLACDPNRQGLSIGWADTYAYWQADQWIDLGLQDGGPYLADGEYAVVSTADPLNHIAESNENNNVAVAFFRVQGTTITPMGGGQIPNPSPGASPTPTPTPLPSPTPCGTCAPAVMTVPAPGSTLAGASVTFRWSAGVGVSQYVLQIGNAPLASDILLASTGLERFLTVNNLPLDSRTLHVRLSSFVNGAWQHTSTTYQAASVVKPTPLPSPSASPAPRSADANGDGFANATDALCVLRQSLGFPGTTSCPSPLPNGDVNGDSLVSALDALCILRAIGGFLATPNCPLPPTFGPP